MINDDAMKMADIKRENPFLWMIKKKLFWVEILIMFIGPLPMTGFDSLFGFGNKIVYMPCVNWSDNSTDGFPEGTHVYDTPYLTNDFLLGFMFLRFLFVLQTIIVLSPPNNQLVAKRVCHE